MKIREILFLIFFGGCTLSAAAQSGNYRLKITHLTDSLYVYVSYGSYKEKKYPANGLYLVTSDGVVLFDTPWDSVYYQPLLDSIQHRHHKKVILCISTHYHLDRTGGLDYYAAKGIKTYTTRKTDSFSILHHHPRAEFLIDRDTTFSVGETTFNTFYPGPGHTADNIVIWFPQQQVLYGGCLIKSVSDSNLGNLEDANLKAWRCSLRKLQKKYPHPEFIIVGHNDWTDHRSIRHTLKLLSEIR